MGAVGGRLKRCCSRNPAYNNVNPTHITTDPGRSFAEMFANLSTYGIDLQQPSEQDLANLDWLREVRAERGQGSAEVEADKARWAAQARELQQRMVRESRAARPKRYKPKVPKTPEEEAAAAVRRSERHARNEARRRRRELQNSLELVPLH